MENILLKNVTEYFETGSAKADKEIKQAKQDLAELRHVVGKAKENNLPLLDLCQLIGGHNYNGELFDVNFGKNILATVKADYTICEDIDMYMDDLSSTSLEVTTTDLDKYEGV